MKLKFLLFLFLSACGVDVCEESDFTTKHNICVFTNGYDVTKEEIELVTDYAQREVTSRYPKKYSKDKIDTFEDVSLTFKEDVRGDKASGETEYRYGPFTDNRIRVRVEYHEESCRLRWFIYVHELLHVYLITVEDEHEHLKGWFIMDDFTEEENISSIQFKAWSDVVPLVCPLE